MQEIIEQAMNYLRGIWRFRWYAMLLVWLVALSGWVMVTKMPDQYEASARVHVNTESILRPLLRGLAVQTDVGQRVRLLTQTLLSRPNLEKVARMTDQDIKAKTPEQMESLLDSLANNIVLSSTRQERNLYTISYQHRDPQIAKSVVQAILTIFVEGSLGEVRRDSDSAQKFLDQQIAEYEQKLVEAENRLTQFKRENLGLLPDQGGDFYTRLQQAHAEHEQAKLLLNEAKQRRDELQRQLEDAEDAQEDNLFSGVSTPLTSSLDARIQSLHARLDEMLLRYTERHPDVKEIKYTIAALEKQKSEEISAMSAEEKSSLAGADSMYQQLKLALSQSDANVAAAEVRVKEYRQREENLRKLMDTLPQVETELKRLNRDYSVNKKNYDALLTRRESAKMSEDAEQAGDNVKFRVIDPPRVPINPAGPNRPLFSSFVLLLSLGVGVAVAFLLSQINPAIYDSRVLRQVAGYPVFGSVSRVWTPATLKKKRLEYAGFMLASFALFMAYGGVFVLHGSDGGQQSIVQLLKGLSL